MKQLHVERRPWTPDGKRQQPGPIAETARLVEPGVTLIDDGSPVLVYGTIAPDLRPVASWLMGALGTIRWEGTAGRHNHARLAGFNNAHRTFGFSAPQPLRRRYGCAPCAFDRESPSVSSALASLAAGIGETLDREVPDIASRHRGVVESSVLPDWRIGSAPWTSGIVNRTAALPYHRDSGNLPGSWSAMLMLRSRMGGGWLHLPEFDLVLDCAHATVVIFDGQGTWHGVTPLRPDRGDAVRYSVVWYAKSAMKKCAPLADEAERAAREATR